MTTQTETPTTPAPGSTAEEKIQQLRDLFAYLRSTQPLVKQR